MKIRRMITVCTLMICMSVSALATTKTVGAASTRTKACKLTVGWWTQNSSGGYDLKVGKTKIKYFKHNSNKVAYTAKIKHYKTIKGGYLVQVQRGKSKYCYAILRKQKKVMEYYSGWKKKGSKYSGSSSLAKGRW